MGQILVDGVSEFGDGKRLQPDSPRAGQSGKKNPIAAEDHILDARHGRDLKRNAGLKRADMSGMNAQGFPRLQVTHDQLPGEFQPGGALSAEPLQQKAVAAEYPRAQRLLETHTDLNL